MANLQRDCPRLTIITIRRSRLAWLVARWTGSLTLPGLLGGEALLLVAKFDADMAFVHRTSGRSWPRSTNSWKGARG
jgi:hypothetical protein